MNFYLSTTMLIIQLCIIRLVLTAHLTKAVAINDDDNDNSSMPSLSSPISTTTSSSSIATSLSPEQNQSQQHWHEHDDKYNNHHQRRHQHRHIAEMHHLPSNCEWSTAEEGIIECNGIPMYVLATRLVANTYIY